MIKGKKRKAYNDFEEEILSIGGSIQDSIGLAFFYEHIHQTFYIAEKAVLLNSKEYKAWYESEDYESRQSISLYDVGYQINTVPLIEVLRNAHFITIHSEFESAWKEIFRIYNQYHPIREYASFNDKFLKKMDSDPTFVLYKAVKENEILISYNYLRNKIVHQDASTSSPEYLRLKKYVEFGEIEYLKFSEISDRATFIIMNNKFLRTYAERVTKFITDIADISFDNRQSCIL